MNNALSFDIEDWFQVENLKTAIARDQWDSLELRVETNTHKILALLREANARATFFILGWVAERCPELVREIDRDGHEVASHGYGHGLVYDMTPEAFREDLLRSKKILEDIVKKPVTGYRAPSFSITPRNLWALEILKETGFDYDSSVFPVSMHDRYGFPGCSTRPFLWPNGLVEIPLSVYRIGRLSLPAAGGGYFRLLPYGYFRRIFTRLNRCNEAVTFYMHPWELDPGQPRVRVPWFYRFRHYVNLSEAEGRLRRLLRDFRFTTLSAAHSILSLRGKPSAEHRIRVVLIIDRLATNLAGTENQLLKIIDGLDTEHFELHLISFNNHPWLEKHRSSLNCQTHVVEINRFKRLATYVNCLRLVSLLRALRPDIVHTFFPVGNIVGVLCARLAGIKHIVSSRRDYGEWMRKGYLLATRFANLYVSRVVSNSRLVGEMTRHVEKVDGRRIEVICNGIDLSAFAGLRRDENLKRELGIPQANRVVGLVANFRPMKHHQTLVQAVPLILRERNDVDFVLIGTDVMVGGLRERVKTLAQNLGVQGRLRFVDVCEDVLPYLSIMDIGVNCSEGEGMSNAVMEYMAAGVPCVVSDSGGNPDLVSAEVHGAVFRLDDHIGLANEILRLLGDTQRCDRFVRNARRRMESEMSLPAMLKAYERFYRRLVGADGNCGKPGEESGAG